MHLMWVNRYSYYGSFPTREGEMGEEDKLLSSFEVA